MGTVVLDTSVILAMLDPADALHASAVTSVKAHRALGAEFEVPASVVAEALVGAHRIGTAAVTTTERFIDSLVSAVRPIDLGIAREAAALRAKHGSVRLPDAFVLATATSIGATTIITGDKRWTAVDPRVELISELD